MRIRFCLASDMSVSIESEYNPDPLFRGDFLMVSQMFPGRAMSWLLGGLYCWGYSCGTRHGYSFWTEDMFDLLMVAVGVDVHALAIAVR